MGIGLVRNTIVWYTNHMYTLTDKIKKSLIELGAKENISLSEMKDRFHIAEIDVIDENGIIARAFTKVKAAENPRQMLDGLQ